MPGRTTKMKALVGGDSGGYRLADDVEVPMPGRGMLLCRVYAVALSPYDAKIVDFSNTPGAVGGCDFAGVVVAVGEGVARFCEGERVFAVTFGLNPTDKTAGAFAEYALASEHLTCHVPDNVRLNEACSMGLGIATAGLALFQAPGLQLDLSRLRRGGDRQGEAFVLVSGGATGTGTMALQLLKSAGYAPIATCSPANNALCESYGAVACFDYNSATCGAEIREYTADSLVYIFDCVTDASTMKMCYAAMSSSGGQYIALESLSSIIKYTRRDVRADWLMAPTITGKSVDLPGSYGRPSTTSHRELGKTIFLLAEQLVREGRIRHHPIEERKGGLAKIPAYLNDLRVGNVRGKRQVVPLLEE